MSDSVPSLKSVGRAIDRWLDCVDADGNEVLKQAAIADLLAYSRHHDPAWKAAREAMETAERALMEYGAPPHAPIMTKLRTALAAMKGEGNG